MPSVNYNRMNSVDVAKSLAAGSFKPHMMLTNMSMAYFENPANFVSGKIFPMVPVQLSTGKYYEFSREDLARDNMRRKPEFGKVTPAMMGLTTKEYDCKVDQIIVGTDEIQSLNYLRSGAPGAANPKMAKMRFATEQAQIHLDRMFADNYFKTGAWTEEWAGVTTTPSGKQFYKFNDSNCDPIKLMQTMKREVQKKTRRVPNKIAIGVEAFDALINNSVILDRIKAGGSTVNPATANENVLAQLFGVDQVVQLQSTYNSADLGETESMNYICDSKSMLLCYAPNSPAIDEPSAGYTFNWDMLGGGQPMVFSVWPGENGTHTEFVEGLCSYDMRKTCDDLGVFFKTCC